MGGRGYDSWTLQELIDKFEAQRKISPTLTEKDVIISSFEDDPGSGISIKFKAPPVQSKKQSCPLDEVIEKLRQNKEL